MLNNLSKKTIRFIFKSSIIDFFIILIFLLLLNFFSAFIFFDKSRIIETYGSRYDLPYYDYFIINNIGIEGVSIQGYFFIYIILMFLLLVFILFDANIAYKKEKNIISLLIVRGYPKNKSNMFFFFSKSILYLMTYILSLILFFICASIFNAIINIKLSIVVLTLKGFLYNFFIPGTIYILLNLFVYTYFYNEKRIIKTIRNFY